MYRNRRPYRPSAANMDDVVGVVDVEYVKGGNVGTDDVILFVAAEAVAKTSRRVKGHPALSFISPHIILNSIHLNDISDFTGLMHGLLTVIHIWFGFDWNELGLIGLGVDVVDVDFVHFDGTFDGRLISCCRLLPANYRTSDCPTGQSSKIIKSTKIPRNMDADRRRPTLTDADRRQMAVNAGRCASCINSLWDQITGHVTHCQQSPQSGSATIPILLVA